MINRIIQTALAVLWIAVGSCSTTQSEIELSAPATLDSLSEVHIQGVISDIGEYPALTLVRFYEPRKILGYPGLLTVVYLNSRILGLEWSRDDFASWALPAAGMLKDSISLNSNRRIRDQILAASKISGERIEGNSYIYNLGNGRELTFDTTSNALHLSHRYNNWTGRFWSDRPIAREMDQFLTLTFEDLSRRVLSLEPFPQGLQIGGLRVPQLYHDTIFGIPGKIVTAMLEPGSATVLWVATPAANKMLAVPTQLYELLSDKLGDPIEDNDSAVYWHAADSTLIRLVYIRNEELNLARTKMTAP